MGASDATRVTPSQSMPAAALKRRVRCMGYT
jgi:hypothetical protein